VIFVPSREFLISEDAQNNTRRNETPRKRKKTRKAGRPCFDVITQPTPSGLAGTVIEAG
jgi:hypothetical protein